MFYFGRNKLYFIIGNNTYRMIFQGEHLGLVIAVKYRNKVKKRK